ncbi:MAG: alginate export family protein [Cytophagales bacterium]|nr:alginate export family protein [Cytophagales bacterium]
MKTQIKLFFILSLSLASTGAFAQLTLKGQFIPRSEYRHGYKDLSATSQQKAVFVSQRTRLMLGYTDAKYKFGLSVQDVRTWGSQSQLNVTDGLISVHEAWGEVNFNETFSAKLGRQELVYDDHRIFGHVGWTMQARSHDLALFKVKKDKMKLHLGFAYNQDAEQLTTNLYTVASSYKAMQFAWLNTNFSENVNTSFLFLNNGVQLLAAESTDNKNHTKYSQTIGARTVVKGETLSLSGSVYLQTGEVGNKDLSAYDVMLDLTYKGVDNFEFTPGVELLSGTSQTEVSSTETNSFNPLYGTNHKFNGFMDYFYVGNHGNSVGLNDIFFKIGYKMEKSKLSLDTHFFSANESISDGGSGEMDANLGTEIDITYGLNYSKDISFHFGYSQMFGTESLVALRGGDESATSNWAYVMLKLKPDFLKKKEAE